MSDERIDLTQFEGIWDKKHDLFIEKTPTDGYHWSVLFENDVEAGMSTPSWYGKIIHKRVDRFYHAIDKLPDLLAELKRCYEREDALIEALKIVRDDLDDALETKGYNTLAHEKSERTLQRIRNFANDASQ